jgi:hypothetical protein
VGSTPQVKQKTETKKSNAGLTWRQLRTLDFPQSQWIVEGLLPVGLNLLVGKPKLGKSIICQNISLAIVQGSLALGKFPAQSGDVLSLVLEDPMHKFLSRLNQMLNGSSDKDDFLERAHVYSRWPRMPDGLIQLNNWLGAHKNCKLVTIDTWGEFRPRYGQSGDQHYDRDHAEVQEVQRLAQDRCVSIILVTHERKSEGHDILDRVSGSIGITAAADNFWIFERPDRLKAQATLIGGGRDIRDVQYQIMLNDQNCSWVCEGSLENPDLKVSEAAVLRILKDRRGAMTSVQEIVAFCGFSKMTVYNALGELEGMKLVKYSKGQRKYSIA